ncbi:hypothetical protein P152DRAFT_93337 [Eremomyces bilateralis CBS 781.70]|uniref:Meiotically up-regulated protein Msb1/Mug8 domain-containing protein n=1 Tax=Eremomyces bilateralis CBS 781.70 TaxID=1392243 RepID=A0A6G1FYP0_9PEZI|nr:uncharacterized protein P152DRAFT_93337 [Eremomyces bilateralis CBS 781.70]KAF1810679.1 hypothetical protein P152DRAFT_93337 [Eremomyces bilateralis CBS 781.70]
MSFFSRVFRSKGAASKKNALPQNDPVSKPKPRWEDAWSRTELASEEVRELIHECTHEMKSRALDTPFVMLPFRPDSDTSSAKSLVRNFFKAQYEESGLYTGTHLQQELRLTEPMVLCSVLKWCWSRLAGGLVTWDAYEVFKIGEQDSNMARNAFDTFIPLSVDSDARKQIIFDFFDLLAAVAARSKTNGLGGRKLSRMAGWWAFEHTDQGNGFDGGYKSWTNAADACSHLFFAYLRSLSPDSVGGISGISAIPRSLQALLSQTEYPPETPTLLQTTTSKVVMIVDAVSPTPFALLRRSKNFEYRDDDEALQTFSAYEDPVKALTDECCRVLNAISHTNESKSTAVNPKAEGASDPSWSRFEDLGFNTGAGTGADGFVNKANGNSSGAGDLAGFSAGLRGTPQSHTAFGRPTTPSWADFLSTGFVDDKKSGPSSLLLPPDKVLPPIGEQRGHSSQSHVRHFQPEGNLEPGELASITQFDLDDTFWWVWITSLAGEEPAQRKAVFGRCALIETDISGARWLLIEEQVKGASPGPEEGAYIAEKKSRFSFSRRGRLARKKSKNQPPTIKEPYNRAASSTPMKSSIGPDQQAKIQAAAAALAKKDRDRQAEKSNGRRSRNDDDVSQKTNSVLTLQPVIMSEAAPAMKWAKEFDRGAIKSAYLSDPNAGRGSRENLGGSWVDLGASNGSLSPPIPRKASNRELPALPREATPVRSPSPPPLPATPPVETPTRTAAVQEAAGVPLPSLEKKESASEERDHAAWRKGSSSPESVKGGKEPKKLQKQSGGSGFKRIFSRKNKADGPSTKDDSAPPAEPQRKVISAPIIEYNEPDEPSPPTTKPDHVFAPTQPSHPSHTYVDPAPRPQQTSRIGTSEQEEADAEFSRFDQGPLADVPAYVPDSASDHSVRAPSPDPQPAYRHESPPPVPQPAHAQPTREAPAVPLTRPVRKPSPEPTPEPAAAAASAPPPQQPTSEAKPIPVGDRWAQIRKNAQERAARMSEEQTTGRSRSQSDDKTEEGDTSGEETIESRVARIKARVAELTGNMDASGNITTAGGGAKR